MKSEEEKWDICHNVIHKILNKRIQKRTFHKHVKIFLKKIHVQDGGQRNESVVKTKAIFLSSEGLASSNYNTSRCKEDD